MEEEELVMTELKVGDYVIVFRDGKYFRHGLISEIEYVVDCQNGTETLYHIAFNDYPKSYYEMMLDKPTGIFKQEDLVLDEDYKNAYKL